MGTKVLIVDTDEAFAAELAHHLGDRGTVVASLARREDALIFTREHEVDVVLLGVTTPHEQVLESIRTLKLLNPLTQVIVLTRADTLDVAIRGMKLGAYDCIVKPATKKEIEDKVAKAQRLKAAHEERIKRAEVDRLVMKQEW